MKQYTFRYREIKRGAWNNAECVKDEMIEGTIPELRDRLGLKEYERISWAGNGDPDGELTKISTPQRLEHFYNRLNSHSYIVYIA